MGVDGHVTFRCTSPTQAQILYSFRNATLDHLLCFANCCSGLVVRFASTHLSYELCWVSPWGNIKCRSCMKTRECKQNIWNESAKSLMLCLNTMKWQLKLYSSGSKFWTYVPRTYDDFFKQCYSPVTQSLYIMLLFFLFLHLSALSYHTVIIQTITIQTLIILHFLLSISVCMFQKVKE